MLTWKRSSPWCVFTVLESVIGSFAVGKLWVISSVVYGRGKREREREREGGRESERGRGREGEGERQREREREKERERERERERKREREDVCTVNRRPVMLRQEEAPVTCIQATRDSPFGRT